MANRMRTPEAPPPPIPEVAEVSPKPPRKKTSRKKLPSPDSLVAEREEGFSLQKFLQDERTWKIGGTLCLLIAVFLFTAFTSYIFTWKEDQDLVLQNDAALLGDAERPVSNLLGQLGAYVSHFFIYRGFGIASFFLCTFFFVVGINLLFNRRIFSLWRNFKYITFGMLIVSVAAAFVFDDAAFPWGGRVGDMTAQWLVSLVGSLGTSFLLLGVGVCYLIWQFNPAIRMPKRQEKAVENFQSDKEINTNLQPASVEVDQYENDEALTTTETLSTGNRMNGAATPLSSTAVPVEKSEPLFEITEHATEAAEIEEDEVLTQGSHSHPTPESELVADLTHAHDEAFGAVPTALPLPEPKTARRIAVVAPDAFELEIKEAPLPEPDDVAPAEDNRPVEKDLSDLPPFEPELDLRDYKYPSLDMLETHGSEKIVQDPTELEANKNQIIQTLRNYDISIQKISATVGPTVTLYEIVPAAGVRISRIKNLEDDIALSLAALGIRIIAPIPGKGTIGIEVPNHKKSVVSMKTLLASDQFTNSAFALPIAIGKKINNELFIADLASMPHLLMAGATGQGKSVGLNAILVSLLYKKHPSQLKLVLVDPKKVELSIYRHIEKHFLAKLPGDDDEAIITDTKKVIHTLNALCIEMDNRYDLLKEAGARNIREYNEKFVKRRLNPQKGHQFLPFIVLVVDEFADLIMTAGKEVELPIARLAQLARAVGIHLIIATQRPSVNIITGTIKANFPSRIAFKVSSKIDSRTILDAGGAEQLIGKGDMLISHNGELVRLQCAFVDTPEVEEIVAFIGDQRGYPEAFLLPEYIDEKELEKSGELDSDSKDPLFEDAARLVVQNQMGSTSLIQRRMKLGYNRAGRLMDQLERAGVVGPNLGSKAREVRIKSDMELQEHLEML